MSYGITVNSGLSHHSDQIDYLIEDKFTEYPTILFSVIKGKLQLKDAL